MWCYSVFSILLTVESLGCMLNIILVSPGGVRISIICQQCAHSSVWLCVLLYIEETDSPVQSFKQWILQWNDIQIKILRCTLESLELCIDLHVPKFPEDLKIPKNGAPPTSTDLVSHFHSAPAGALVKWVALSCKFLNSKELHLLILRFFQPQILLHFLLSQVGPWLALTLLL